MTATAPVRSTLAAHYRQQADVCRRMANEALSPYDEEWLRLAAKWTKLARQAEVRSVLTADKLERCSISRLRAQMKARQAGSVVSKIGLTPERFSSLVRWHIFRSNPVPRDSPTHPLERPWQQGRAFMLIDFDQTTIANMTAALDSVCKRIPKEKDSHEFRKRIADAMVESAKLGRRTLVDFQNVG